MLAILKARVIMIRSRYSQRFLQVTGSAVMRQALIDPLSMTTLTASHCMCAEQRETGGGVMKFRHLPKCLRMTLAAGIEGSLMGIVNVMAKTAVPAHALQRTIILMAFRAVQLQMHSLKVEILMECILCLRRFGKIQLCCLSQCQAWGHQLA
jgi:hypothetical protein